MLEITEHVQSDGAPLTISGVAVPAIQAELERILRSRAFVHSHRIRRFLQFIVEESLLGQQHRLKEYVIGLEVFRRVEAFDPRVDSIVRVEARRLRAKLEEYYRTEGRDDEIRVELRKGSYVPIFEHHRPGAQAYGKALAPARRNVIAIGRITASQDLPSEFVDAFIRRLSHVLIQEGHCQIVANHNGEAGPDAAGEGASPLPAPDFILEGSLDGNADRFTALMQLLSVAEGSYICSETGGRDGVDHLGRSLTRALVTGSAHNGSSRVQRRRGEQRQSFDHYVQGRYLWKIGTPESIRGSSAQFSKAVERDPSYGAAWAALSESLLLASLFGYLSPREAGPKILEAAHRANELSDSLPEAHVALGAALSIFEWDWEGGERELQRAIHLDPRDASVHATYAVQLACRGLLPAAMAETERALDLDPASLWTNFVLGWLRGVAGHYDEAVAQHSFILQLAPDFPLAYLGLGWAHAGKGRFSDAVSCFTNATHLLKCRTLLSGCLGYCYARMGQPEEAMRHLAALSTPLPNQYISPTNLAALHAGRGDLDRAFQYLEQAAAAHDCSLPLQLLNPEFESVRRDARYQALAQKMGLAPRQPLTVNGLAH